MVLEDYVGGCVTTFPVGDFHRFGGAVEGTQVSKILAERRSGFKMDNFTFTIFITPSFHPNGINITVAHSFLNRSSLGDSLSPCDQFRIYTKTGNSYPKSHKNPVIKIPDFEKNHI